MAVPRSSAASPLSRRHLSLEALRSEAHPASQLSFRALYTRIRQPQACSQTMRQTGFLMHRMQCPQRYRDCRASMSALLPVHIATSRIRHWAVAIELRPSRRRWRPSAVVADQSNRPVQRETGAPPVISDLKRWARLPTSVTRRGRVWYDSLIGNSERSTHSGSRHGHGRRPAGAKIARNSAVRASAPRRPRCSINARTMGETRWMENLQANAR